MSRFFNSSTQPLPGGIGRPSRGGGSSAGLGGAPIVDKSINGNVGALKRPASMVQRETRNVEGARMFGSPQSLPAGKRARVTPLNNQFGAPLVAPAGPSVSAALRAVDRFAPSGATNALRMPGSDAIAPGAHTTDNVYGVPAIQGFGDATTGADAVRMFRMGGVDPRSRTANGMMFSGLAAPGRPTVLDSNRAYHGQPNPDPAKAPGTVGGPNGPPFAALMQQASQAQLDSMTTQKPRASVNATVQKGMTVVPFAPSFTPDDYYGQFMVVLRNAASYNANKADPRMFTTNTPRAGDLYRYMQLSVTGFNYVMASSELAPAVGERELSAERLWDSWEMMGAVINEGAVASTNAAANKHGGVERLLNICQAGPVRVFNMFGKAALRSNARLSFILKRVPRTEIAKIAKGRPVVSELKRLLGPALSSATGVPIGKTAAETLYYKIGEHKEFLAVYSVNEQGEKLHPSPFQLVPYVSNSSAPVPMAARRYYEEDGSVAYGVVIEVGAVFDPIVPGHAATSMAGMVNVDQLKDAGQLDIQAKIVTHHV